MNRILRMIRDGMVDTTIICHREEVSDGEAQR